MKELNKILQGASERTDHMDPDTEEEFLAAKRELT